MTFIRYRARPWAPWGEWMEATSDQIKEARIEMTLWKDQACTELKVSK